MRGGFNLQGLMPNVYARFMCNSKPGRNNYCNLDCQKKKIETGTGHLNVLKRKFLKD